MQQPEAVSPVCSYNEWDPLEEVIVGRLDAALMPPKHPVVTFNVPRPVAAIYRLFGGRRFPKALLRRAQAQLDGFVRLLEAEGVRVRRPDPLDFSRRVRTPLWSSKGFCIACPRDGFMVLGDEILETPMAWRSRYFESWCYNRLFTEYFSGGARWTAAPKPMLRDTLYDDAYRTPRKGEPLRYVIDESEVVFDAADFVRCGRDLFVTRSNVTNELGIAWLRRHLRGTYQIHEVESRCRQPMHIDSTLMPLAPGKLLVNPDYIDPQRLPDPFKSWDVLTAPRPDPIPGALARITSMCSDWISINVLSLDEKRVVVEKSQPSMIRALRDWGFEPIPCDFAYYAPFGGSFHCATLDVRRSGTLESYF